MVGFASLYPPYACWKTYRASLASEPASAGQQVGLTELADGSMVLVFTDEAWQLRQLGIKHQNHKIIKKVLTDKKCLCNIRET